MRDNFEDQFEEQFAEHEPDEDWEDDEELEDEEPDEPKEKKVKIKTPKNVPIAMENFELIALQYENLIRKNISLIFHAYKNYANLQFEDLHQECLIAIFDCIRQYDPTRGVTFGAYLKKATFNKLQCFTRKTLPHFWEKDKEKPLVNGKNQFKRVLVNVNTLDDNRGYYS